MSAKVVAVALGVLCAILAVALAYAFFINNVMLLGLDSEVSSLQSQIANLQNQISALNATITNIQTQGRGTIVSQVQVSGSLHSTQTGTIYFLQCAKFYSEDAIKASSPIVNGKYSVWLVGGQSYDIFVNRYPAYSDIKPDFTLYVPSGVTTFTADF
ncbi:MAG: hypothetical protein NWE94_04945 [Candidatus Bathyarchaeota archaeon]|nr:hypothetical protein [Candidatus Bathyarchaeota archaeon]